MEHLVAAGGYVNIVLFLECHNECCTQKLMPAVRLSKAGTGYNTLASQNGQYGCCLIVEHWVKLIKPLLGHIEQ